MQIHTKVFLSFLTVFPLMIGCWALFCRRFIDSFTSLLCFIGTSVPPSLLWIMYIHKKLFFFFALVSVFFSYFSFYRVDTENRNSFIWKILFIRFVIWYGNNFFFVWCNFKIVSLFLKDSRKIKFSPDCVYQMVKKFMKVMKCWRVFSWGICLLFCSTFPTFFKKTFWDGCNTTKQDCFCRNVFQKKKKIKCEIIKA